MADANELKGNEHKCLIIVNQSNADIILYIYSGLAPFCKISSLSKIIKPNEIYCYHEKTPFKFEIVAKFLDDKKKKTLLGPEKWNRGKLITITESMECQAENLVEMENEMRLCLREIHREEELASGDLYDILGLDMEEVRKMTDEDIKRTITNAYRKQMRIWHPDKGFSDNEIAMQINMAKEILMDDEKRARYHNEVDYNGGWFSRKRWKAVFWSDCCSEEQKNAFRRRNGLFLASVLLAVGGIALSLGTAGAAAPVVVILGGVLGGGFIGAGCLSLGHTVSKKSVLDGCDGKAWLAKAALGFAGGVVTGGAAVGITAGMVGIGSAAMEAGAVTAGQYVGMGSATGAVGGVVASVTSDAAKVIVDKEKVTAKQFFSHAVSGAVLGAGAGALGGIVTKGIVDSRASAATSTLEGDAVEQVSALTGGKRVAQAVGHAVSKQVTMVGTKAVLGTASTVVLERFDDCVENQKITKHARDGLENLAVNTLSNAALYSAGGFIGHGFEEATLDEESYSRNTTTSKEPKAESYTNNNNEAHENIQGSGNETTEDQGAGEENNEPGNETNDDQEDDEPEEQEDDKPEENMCKLSNTKGKKGMNMRKTTGRPRNQSNNANRSKSESGRSHTTSEKGASEQDDQSYEGLNNSTQQNPQVVSEESKANQSSNGESYKENIDGCDGKSGIRKPGFSGDVLILGTGSAATESSAVCQYFAMGSVPGDVGEVVSLDAAKVIVDSGACAATSTLEGGAVEQVSALTEESGVGDAVAHPVSKQVTFAGTKHMLGTASKVVNEPLDDQSSNANRNKCESGRSRMTNENTTPEQDDQSYEGHVVSEESKADQSSNGESYEKNRELSDEVNEKQKADEPDEATIKYKSGGHWVSKMIVTYHLNGAENTKEVSGDGKRVNIPAAATDIKVRFQVRRPSWGDIKKYDRFQKCWVKEKNRYIPHIFEYKKATNRTFTIDGPLWWEAVMRITNERHDETNEMS